MLPLIDNSIYTGLAAAVGEQPEHLDSLPVPRPNIFSLAVRLDKAALVQRLGLEGVLKEPEAEQAAARDDAAAAALTLKQLGLAWHNYHDTFKAFPTAEGFDAEGNKTRLSWRVGILPFLDQSELYEQFHWDEPWDSEHNRKLIPRMPAVYRPANEKLAAEGKTRFVMPTGAGTIAPDRKRPTSLADIVDGTSNTIMLVEADDEHAVVWTRPDDLKIDLEKPLRGLAVRPPGGFVVVMADGSVVFFRTSIAPRDLGAMFTRAGGEPVAVGAEDRIALRLPGERRASFGPAEQELRSLRAGEFLAGVGNQISMHVYDTDPLFAFSLPNFLGMSLATFRGGRGFLGGDESLWIGLLVSALNSPVYIAVPVEDAQKVDDFLMRLDGFLAQLARRTEGGRDFFRIEQDFYRLQLGDTAARGYGFQFGPVKWRFFWARIGDGLYLASKPFVLQDLAAMEAEPQRSSDATDEDLAHALVRMRPQNWDRVLPAYQLGWAENNRIACLKNLGPLAGLVRAFDFSDQQTVPQRHAALVAAGERHFDSHLFCPQGGQYTWLEDGQLACTVHGSASEPRQPEAPSRASQLGRLLSEFSDLRLNLSFLEDGLHAVVTISRKQ